MKAVIVIPTIRETSIQQFLNTWEPSFRDHMVIVVEDNEERTFDLPNWVSHVAWDGIEHSLGADAWIIPRRTGAIRNYGILKAGRLKPDMIVMLDDDCLPVEGTLHSEFLEDHWKALNTTGLGSPLFDTMHSLDLAQHDIHPRGFPYETRKPWTVLNHGLWNGVPDLDGRTQLRVGTMQVSFARQSAQVPIGSLFPMSAMNVAFRPQLLPAMYQMPMGQGQPFHRFDDIWCGLIMKKACDTMGYCVKSGSPAIQHVRASDARKNAEQEAPGIIENERVWQAIRNIPAVKHDLDSCLESIMDGLTPLGSYWRKAADAASIWRRLVSA